MLKDLPTNFLKSALVNNHNDTTFSFVNDSGQPATRSDLLNELQRRGEFTTAKTAFDSNLTSFRDLDNPGSISWWTTW